MRKLPIRPIGVAGWVFILFGAYALFISFLSLLDGRFVECLLALSVGSVSVALGAITQVHFKLLEKIHWHQLVHMIGSLFAVALAIEVDLWSSHFPFSLLLWGTAMVYGLHANSSPTAPNHHMSSDQAASGLAGYPDR